MLLRNSLWNLSGSALPSIVSLATVPLLIYYLGLEGFGIVTLLASVIGYFAVLDINLSAGAIKYLAETHASDDRKKFAETFWFGMLFYGVLGLAGCAAIFFAADWLVGRFFEVTPQVRADTVLALQIGALGFLLAQIQNYLLVVPQSLQRYDRSAQSEALFGILFSVVSVAAAMAGGGIVGVTAVRVGLSVLNIVYLVWIVRQFDINLAFCWPQRAVRSALTSFSAYAYLSKLASTMHQHGDKLIVGAMLGPVALTFYTVPVTLAGRILGLTYRLSSVIYPRASALSATQRMSELRPIYFGAMRHITYINLIALGMIALAGDQFLHYWVGEEFVTQGYPILVLITIALLADSLTNLPSLVNDALGHPRVTGLFALARGVIGLSLIYVGALFSGIVGVATAHVVAAVLLSVLFLAFVHGRTVPFSFADTMREGWGRSIAVGLVIFAVLFPLKWLMPGGLIGTVMIVSAALAALAMAGFAFIINVEERAALMMFARRFRLGGPT